MSDAKTKPGRLVDRSVQWVREDARHDALAGLTVAAVLGSSNHLVTGPTNAICMVVLSLTAHLPQR